MVSFVYLLASSFVFELSATAEICRTQAGLKENFAQRRHEKWTLNIDKGNVLMKEDKRSTKNMAHARAHTHAHWPQCRLLLVPVCLRVLSRVHTSDVTFVYLCPTSTCTCVKTRTYLYTCTDSSLYPAISGYLPVYTTSLGVSGGLFYSCI